LKVKVESVDELKTKGLGLINLSTPGLYFKATYQFKIQFDV